MDEFNPKLKRSLFELLGDVPTLIKDLVRAEVEAYKAEMIAKGKSLAFGAGLFAAAAFLLFWVFAVLIASAVLAFALVVPGWAAALIVAAILLAIIALLVLLGVSRMKEASKTPEESVKERIQQDVDAVKGEGVYE